MVISLLTPVGSPVDTLFEVHIIRCLVGSARASVGCGSYRIKTHFSDTRYIIQLQRRGPRSNSFLGCPYTDLPLPLRLVLLVFVRSATDVAAFKGSLPRKTRVDSDHQQLRLPLCRTVLFSKRRIQVAVHGTHRIAVGSQDLRGHRATPSGRPSIQPHDHRICWASDR